MRRPLAILNKKFQLFSLSKILLLFEKILILIATKILIQK